MKNNKLPTQMIKWATWITYNGTSVKPASISAGRWSAMVKRILQEFPELAD